MNSIQAIRNSFQMQPHQLTRPHQILPDHHLSSIGHTEHVELSPENIRQALTRDLKEQMHHFIQKYPEFKPVYPQSASVTLEGPKGYTLQIGPYDTSAILPGLQREATTVMHEQISNFIDKNYSIFQYLADDTNHIQLEL